MGDAGRMKRPFFISSIMPKTLRARLLLTLLLVVTVPIVSTGYVLKLKGRDALIEEKQTKLFGLAKMLDAYLADGFDDLLDKDPAAHDDRLGKIRFLNARLRDYTDVVAAANPGVGVGYYSRELNAIVTYGPSREYDDKVGMSIPATHPGWKVMNNGEALVESGPLVRGHIMNAMWPIIRGGQVTGYIWANEFTDDIEHQARSMDNAIVAVTSLGLIMSLALSILMTGRLTRDVDTIKNGMNRMQHDLREPIRPLHGEMGEIVSAMNDMAKALLDARSLNENILWSIADGIVTVDVKGMVTSINPAAQQILGVGRDEILGRPYATLFNSDANFSSLLLDTLESGKDHVGVSIDVPLKDRTLHVSSSTSLLRDGRGLVIGAVAVIKDISETKQLQRQVIRADRLAALGELVAGIAHDIRNPLTSIRGFVQFLQKSGDPRDWQEYGPLIIREVDGLNRIIGELLEFAKPYPPRYGSVQVNDLIREMLILVKKRADTQSIQLELRLDPSLSSIEADGEQLKQVLLNLMINSCQAIAERGTITIVTEMERSDWLNIHVIDDGAGILKEHIEKVFDPFFSTKPAGTGLGLAVVQRIINNHHGMIEIISEPGRGTDVKIGLPRICQTSEVE
jgi:two-component system, NtrC family, sensor histidine kinase AtoS